MKRFKNILVVANSEGFSDALISRALWLAKANGAALTVLDVTEDQSGGPQRLWAKLSGEVRARLDAARRESLDSVAEQLQAGGAEVSTQMAQGIGFIEIIRCVLGGGFDLLIKDAEPSLPTWQVLGGPDLHLLRKCPCPVWILNTPTEPSGRRIVAAVDPDPEDPTRDALNQQVMQMATSLAVQDVARLDVLNAWHLPDEALLRGRRAKMAPDAVDAMAEEARQDSLLRLDTLVAPYKSTVNQMDVLHIKGVAADVIAQHTVDQRIDTLVMGTLGRQGLPGLFIGNTADTVLTRVSCSVLAIKPPGFVSPVTRDTGEAS